MRTRAMDAAESAPSTRRTTPILPKEILLNILSHLERSAALAFTRVFPFLSHEADPILWEHVTLRLHPYHGFLPDVHHHGRQGWGRQELDRVELRQREDMRLLLQVVLNRGDERRWGMVRRVTATPRATAIAQLVTVLHQASSTLEELFLEAPHPHERSTEWRLPDPHTFDYACINAGLHFPSLTYLHFGNRSLRHTELVTLLLAASPNVKSLDVDIVQPRILPKEDAGYLPLQAATKLERARLSYREEFFQPGHVDRTLDPMMDVFKHSPDLRQVSLDPNGTEEFLCEALLSSLKTCSGLEDLHWAMYPHQFNTGGMYLQMPKLRRLILVSNNFQDVLRYLPIGLPALEVLYLDLPPRKLKPAQKISLTGVPPPAASPWPVQDMFPGMAGRISENPVLSRIYTFEVQQGDVGMFDRLDALDLTPYLTCLIRSYRGPGDRVDKLYHVRLFTDHIVDAVHDPDDPPDYSTMPASHTALDYEYEDELWTRVYRKCEPCWVDLTYYEDEVVPLRVLEEMRRKDGKTEAEWDGRGVKVGKKAWKILEDWYGGLSEEESEGEE